MRSHTTTKSLGRGFKGFAIAAAIALGVTCAPKPAAAQEIQLTGPLAGAPSVRKLRLYREGRFEFALGAGFTLLDEYKRTIFLSGRLQYNVFDWLGFGVWGGVSPSALSLNTDLTDKIEANAPRNSRTAINLPSSKGSPNFDEQVGQLRYVITPQVTFSPFRGKLALLQKLFIDTDLYIHAGAAFVGVSERGDCGAVGQISCTDKASFTRSNRIAVAPSFGLGLSLYPSSLVSVNIEYRAMPFSYNRGGFDSRGTGPDASFPDNKINSEDRTFKFNQMIFIGAGFHFPVKQKISD